MKKLVYIISLIRSRIQFRYLTNKKKIARINLCSGLAPLSGYWNVDICQEADYVLDLGKRLLPLKDSSAEIIVCISAINYFTRKRGEEIIKDVYRTLKSGGITRFGTQDLDLIAEKYVEKDRDFFFQKLSDGRDRFKGKTMCDKINAWFAGYNSTGGPCRYFYDYETLSSIFAEVGFREITRKRYRESAIPDIEKIDNREGQMFFLEAIK